MESMNGLLEWGAQLSSIELLSVVESNLAILRTGLKSGHAFTAAPT